MRYFLVTYYTQPNGQMDEVAAVSKSLKRHDLAQSSIILDFKNKSVLKCSWGGQIIPKEWDKIRDYYNEHYPNYVSALESAYATLETVNEKEDNPS